jgi:nucleoside-diphosphate-sugar epimerase
VKILLTGAFGNIGGSALPELLRRGHQVRCFVRKHKANERVARRFAEQIEVVWGDVRRREDLELAVQDQEVIIHLAYVLPPESDDDPALAYETNVNGTRNVLEAASKLATAPKILFSSTFDVFGFTQDQPPPRNVSDPVQATDAYTEQKITCEEMVKTSGLQWAIFRFADVPPLVLRRPHPIMFRLPLDTRIEVIHTYDAGLALANAMKCEHVWGTVQLIGGGPRCQIYYRDYLGSMLEVMGIGMLPEQAFSSKQYCTDWLDTTESQRLLHYQRYSFEDIIRDLSHLVGYRKYFVPLLRPAIRQWILRMSPYLRG